MIPWTLIETVAVPGQTADQTAELKLLQRDSEFSIQIGNEELMNSREHGSEDALAELSIAKIQNLPLQRLLIGGLGMGYTLAAALKHGRSKVSVEVAELLPAVVSWNQGPIGHLAGNPLNDSRVTLTTSDVTRVVKSKQQAYEAILLDIDNGPAALTTSSNRWLYSLNGLKVLFAALVPGGILSIWSAGADPNFTIELEKAGFVVEVKRVKSRGNKGSTHFIWLAQRPLKALARTPRTPVKKVITRKSRIGKKK